MPTNKHHQKPDRTRRHRRASQERVAQIHGSQRWRKLSLEQRQRYPICMAPFCRHFAAGRAEPSRSVHHIYPIETHPQLAFTPRNCCPVCWTCHHHVEQLEKAGTPTAQLFAGWQELDR